MLLLLMVTSHTDVAGYLHGLLFGSLLFICYNINDVVSGVSEGSGINLFADDTALYRVIKSPAD